MKKSQFLYIVILGLFATSSLFSQAAYHREQLRIINMLEERDSLNLQKAVFAVENAYYNGVLNESSFNRQIEQYVSFCRVIMASGDIQYIGTEKKNEKQVENENKAAKAQCAVFVFMTDSIPVQVQDTIVYHYPYEYNFEDYAGNEQWSNMFVTTLMKTRKGNCHSMPLLYKLIMDNLGEKSWLALAPNHLYIKAWNRHTGWYNIELTCGDFPTDAWLMASGYIHMDAIRNNVYMDTLSVKQSIVLCLTDLAQGYMHKYGIGDGRFILECLNTGLKYYPDYINALLLKTEILTTLYRKRKSDLLREEIDTLCCRIHNLGYRRMPEDMYLKWLRSLTHEYSERHRIRKIISSN